MRELTLESKRWLTKYLKDGSLSQEEADYIISKDPTQSLFIDWLTAQYMKRDKKDGDWKVYKKLVTDYLKNFMDFVKKGLIYADESNKWNDIHSYKTIGDLEEKLNSVLDSKEYQDYLEELEKEKRVAGGSLKTFESYYCENCKKYMVGEEVKSHSCKYEGKKATHQELIKARKLKVAIQVIKLENIDATQNYCKHTTWCLNDADVFNKYKENLSCNFYLVINRFFKPSNPCYKFMVMAFPPAYKSTLRGVAPVIQNMMKKQDTLDKMRMDQDLMHKVEKFKEYYKFFSEVIDDSERSAYLVFTSNDKMVAFKVFKETFMKHYKIPKEAFTPPADDAYFNMMEAQAADVNFAKQDKLLVKGFSINEDNKITRLYTSDPRRDLKPKQAMFLDNPNTNRIRFKKMGMLADIAHEAYAAGRQSWSSGMPLETNLYFDHPSIEEYRGYKYVLISTGLYSHDDYAIYMAINPPRPHHNYFVLISKKNPDEFYFVRYLVGQPLEIIQIYEFLKHVEAVYVQKEVDNKMAYYCGEEE